MKKFKKALVSLTIAGMIFTMFTMNALADDVISTRLAGISAVQTSQAIAQDGWTTSLNAVLAPSSAYNMVDTLAAAPLAAALNAPILLTGSDHLSTKSKDEITRLGVKVVYVTSGQTVIKPGVITELQILGVDVVNLGGFDQYETSVKIAKEVAKVAPTTSIFIANGEASRIAQDALSVAAIAGAQKQPLLLTQKGQLPKVVADYIASIKANVTASYITGGTGVVSDEVKSQLPGTVYRNGGLDAYDTNLEVLKNFTTLDYTRIFVANGETMIDALAGAPLAAQSKSPIILVNGEVKTDTTDYLKTKVTKNTVVTALGGSAVVPEKIRESIANPDPGQLDITDVLGSTSDLFAEDSAPVLEFTVGGVEKTVSQLTSAGFTVEFQATEPVFYGGNYDSTDGLVNMQSGNVDLSVGSSFEYKVVISKGDIVATSPFKKVTVKAGSSSNSGIESAEIYLANDGQIDGDNVEIESGTLTVDDEAYLRVRGIDSNDGYGSITSEAKYSTSDPSIAFVDKSSLLSYNDYDYAKIVLNGQTGTVTLTITTTNGTQKTLTLDIVDETRKISTYNTVFKAPGNLKLSGPTTSEAFGVTVKDQFGDPIKGYALNPKDAITNSDIIAQAVAVKYDEENPVGYDADVRAEDAATDCKGRVVILIKGGSDEGAATMRIQDEESNTLDSITVSNQDSSRPSANYKLALAPFRTSTLDASDSVDNVTYLMVNAYDSAGYKTSDADLSDLTVKIDGYKISDDGANKYVTVDTTNLNSDGYIIVTAKKITSSPTTIALYQDDSSILLASMTVQVKDNRSKITRVTFESNIPVIYSSSGIKLDRVLKESGIKTNDGNPVTFENVDDNHVLIRGIDKTVIGNLKLSVVEGDLYPTFSTDENGDIRILLKGSDDGENGIIRMTVNKLTGEDVNGVPGTATSVGYQNMTVTDLIN